MIDPNAVSTIRVGELSPEPFSLTDNVPHEVGTELKRGTIEDLATFISAFIGSTDGVGFRAISVTDGQTLPTTTQQEFILVGKGTYYNVVGGSTIICTEELNAIVSNGSYWFIGVEIPINVELAGITQFIRDGFINTTPSEDTVHEALALKSNVADSENIANKQNSLAVDGTNTKYPTVTAINHNLSLRANYGSNLIIDEALIDGYYIDVTGNGAVNTVEGYSITSFMEVSQTSYLLSDTYQQWAVYDSDFTFITGSFSDEGGGYVPPVPYKKEIDIPPSARYIRLTIRNIEKDAFYIARKNLYAKEFSIVAKKGGDFSTVQAAVNASFENQTIYIYPGVYEETVNTVGRKVKLIGFDKSSTKITTNGGSYYFPPLECSGGTYAENITFEATSYNPVSHTINAYAVHMDFEGEGVTEFNNCSLISHQNAGIGAGLHNNQTLKLNNCDIIKYSDGAVFNGGALYFHNSPFPNEQNQILEVTGCRIFTDNGKAIIIDDARYNAGGVDINTIMTFSNNRVHSLTDNYDCVTYSNTPIDGGVSGRIRLSLDSYGNSIDKLNKIKFLDNFANQSFNGTKQFNEPLISRGYYLFGNAGSVEWKLINDYNELNDFNIVRGSNVAFSINSYLSATFSSTVTATSFNGSATLTGTPTAPTATAGTNTEQIATTAFVQANSSARPYKVYTALIKQTAANAPTADVLENTLGGTVVWSRNSVGVYVGTLENGFSLTLSKVRIFISGGEPSLNITGFYNALPNNIDSVQVNTRNTSGSLADSLMSTGATIEIRVYL